MFFLLLYLIELSNSISSENLKNARSRIEDADMAKEISNKLKEDVISQAGMMMISHLNNNMSNILSFIQ